jgi:hypothetical protein
VKFSAQATTRQRDNEGVLPTSKQQQQQRDNYSMGDEHPDILQTTSSRSLRIPTVGRVPNIEEDVFISVEGTVEKIKVLLEKYRVVFVRAGVASGKTTLAQYMVEELRDEFVEVEYASTTEGWYGQLVRASGRTDLRQEDDPVVRTREALRDIGKQGKAIVIDEAHILFSFPDVIRLVVKETEKRNGPKILLFSAAATGHQDGIDSTTPPEVKARFMWHPPIPQGNTLVDLLKDAGVRLSADSVDFFMKLCSGRRGIFMHAMDWVKEGQEGSTDDEWDYRETISRVRQALDTRRKRGLNGWKMGLFRYLKESRAVRVNSRYSDLNNIPTEFVEVLYGGPKTKAELNGRERELTVAGFLVPEQQKMGEEFEPYDWDFPNVRYAISCSMMAEFYKDAFALDYGFELIPQKRSPSSAADLLARVVPFLSFATVVDNSIPDSEGKLQSSLSYEGMPYEDNYNSAISNILSNVLKYTVANPLGASGKTDVVVTLDDNKTCAIESIMASRGRVSRTCQYHFVSARFLR